MKSLAELQSLKGRVALITGGAGHLGQVFARTALELGAEVVLTDFNERVKEVAAKLAEEFPDKVEGIVNELADFETTRALPGQVVERFGRLDILINNASFAAPADLKGWSVPLAEQGTEAWQAVMNVDLIAPFVLVQSAAPHLSAHGTGAVVFVSSIYGMVGPDFGLYEGTSMANEAGYNAAKGGLIQLTRYFATAYAPKIRVNCLSPGGILRGQLEVFRQRYEQRTPLKRMAIEEDFVGPIAFLISDASQYCTGMNLAVEGGWTAW